VQVVVEAVQTLVQPLAGLEFFQVAQEVVYMELLHLQHLLLVALVLFHTVESQEALEAQQATQLFPTLVQHLGLVEEETQYKVLRMDQ
jgi:hypothetical protein